MKATTLDQARKAAVKMKIGDERTFILDKEPELSQIRSLILTLAEEKEKHFSVSQRSDPKTLYVHCKHPPSPVD